jgi:hypothetical protein
VVDIEVFLLRAYIVIDIIPYLKEKTLISVVKEGLIRPSSEYRTQYRSFCLRRRSLDFDIGGGKESLIGASSKYHTLYRGFFLRYRSYNFGIEVYLFQYREIFEKGLRYRSQKTSISKFDILYQAIDWL